MMTKLLKMTSLAAVAVAAAAATPALAQVAPSNGNATATARILRPLTLTHVQDLDFGTILLSGAGAWTGAVVHVDQSGVRTCDANVTCSGTPMEAVYNVTGTNNQVVTINTSPVTLNHATLAGVTLTMAVDSPGSVLLTNSGAPGRDFGLGGSITLDSTTTDGVYTGTFDVTVNY